jgi:hypothetical protein
VALLTIGSLRLTRTVRITQRAFPAADLPDQWRSALIPQIGAEFGYSSYVKSVQAVRHADNSLADHEPVEEHPDRGKMLLHRRPRQDLQKTFDTNGEALSIRAGF